MRAPLRPRDICALVLVGVFAVAASGTHVVRSGESLHTIARKHGTTVQALVEANGISNPNLILAGQQLKLPGGATGGPSSGGTYTVRSGDTLASIAARHGTTVSALAKANGISDPNLIVIGRSLHLAGPGSGGATPTVPSASPGSGPQLEGQRHTVQPGETIAGIARRYGLRTEDLVTWNGLVDGKLYATTR
ncbi:MAG: LysM peptidoglycan-binding domain-containing protein, partial [Acidimicrobiia bacterium]